VSAEAVHQYYHPKFNDVPLQDVLEEFEKRESKLRLESKFDKKGRVLKMITGMLGRGGSVTDIAVKRDSAGHVQIGLEDTTGRKKLDAFADKQKHDQNN